jgi:hypothetical protein
MPLSTLKRTFMGPNDFVGFRRLHAYVLRIAYVAEGQISIEIDHATPPGGQVVVSARNFAAWFVRK